MEIQTVAELQDPSMGSDWGAGPPQGAGDESEVEDAEMTAVFSVAWWVLVVVFPP